MINNKIWIQYDATDGGMANDLVALGVPKEVACAGTPSALQAAYIGFAVN